MVHVEGAFGWGGVSGGGGLRWEGLVQVGWQSVFGSDGWISTGGGVCLRAYNLIFTSFLVLERALFLIHVFYCIFNRSGTRKTNKEKYCIRFLRNKKYINPS